MKENKGLFRAARRHLHTAWCEDENCLVNLAGDYDYLESAYYVSQDLEDLGREVHPTCREMLDAYVPPLFLGESKNFTVWRRRSFLSVTDILNLPLSSIQSIRS